MHHEVEHILAAWTAGFDAGDPQAIASLYTADAMFIGGIGGVHLGPVAIAGYFEKNASPATIVFRDVETRAVADGVVIVAMTGAITSGGGGEPRDFRFLQTHVRTPAGWRIAGHHGSHSL
jgi:uncharacterized protein (TIGR02246 family)